jgi:hypothetical protein
MVENVQGLILELKRLKDQPADYMRPVVLVLAGEVRHRIHVEGKRPEGDPIGTYSNSYMRERERNNRTDSRKMIYSLTRQMEQDFGPVADGNEFGLGFNNAWNLQKAMWQEEQRPGVYNLSPYEISLAETTINDYLNGLFG